MAKGFSGGAFQANSSGPLGGGISWSIKFNKLPAYAEGLGRRCRAATIDFAQDVIESLRAKMREPKTGRTYKIRGRYHTASAPGEAPARLSGRTYESLRARNTGRGGTVQIQAGGASRFLQKGTRRMAPRWMVEDEIAKKKPAFAAAIQAAMRWRED